MNTSHPRKLILNLVPKNESISSITSDPITSRIINTECLLDDLTDIIALPPGKLQQLDNVGKFVVFIFMYKEKTRCSDARDAAFTDVAVLATPLLKLPDLSITRNVAWSFFCSCLGKTISHNIFGMLMGKLC